MAGYGAGAYGAGADGSTYYEGAQGGGYAGQYASAPAQQGYGAGQDALYGGPGGYYAQEGAAAGGGQDEWFGGGGGGGGGGSYGGGAGAAAPAAAPSFTTFDPAAMAKQREQQSLLMQQQQQLQLLQLPSSGVASGYAAQGLGGGFDQEPPLLEELGINFEHIWAKTLYVLVPTRAIKSEMLEDTDMAGPLVFCLVQGFCLLFSGKVFFGYVFGFGAVGCLSMYTVINLMNHAGTVAIDVYRVFSVLGYALLPIVVLSACTILLDLRKNAWLGTPLTVLAILWCTQTATRFFEAATNMREQRLLIAYPVFLLYACFALITVF